MNPNPELVISKAPGAGYFLNIYDHRDEVIEFFESEDLQGGGPTWLGLITAAFELDGNNSLELMEMDDEGDGLLISCETEQPLTTVVSYVNRMLAEPGFMRACIEKGLDADYLE
ncbi:MAG: hypothetical protein AAGH19_03670 [Pseudomonadota bacterium]